MKKSALIGLLFGFFPTAVCTAQETIDIERIVVTTSRTQEEIRSATKNTTIIDEQDIKASNAQTIPDVLRTAAGVQIRDYTGSGKTVNVDMRGFGETGPSNMLVLVDGRRANAIDLSGTDWSQIPLSEVERIEIVRGANSVLYGDNAVGGVVNIITKKGQGKPSITLEQKGGSYATWGTSVASNGSWDKDSYRASAEFFDTKGYRKNSGLYRKDFGGQWGHTFTPLLSTNLTFGYHWDRYGQPGALSESQLETLGRRATVKPDDHAGTENYFLNLEVANDFGTLGGLSTAFSANSQQEDSTTVFPGFGSFVLDNQILTFGATPKYTLQTHLADMPDEVILGTDFYYSEDAISSGPTGGPGDKVRIAQYSLGVYAQNECHLNDRLSVKAAGRHERVDHHFEQTEQIRIKEKNTMSNDVYDVGVVFLYGKESSVYADFSTSFKNPLIDEFFNAFTGLDTSLKTQTSKNVEVGIRHSFSRDLGVTCNYFRQAVHNELFFNPLEGPFGANGNYDKTLHQGVEVETDMQVHEAIALFANYTFTSATFVKGEFDGNKIPAVPEHKASGGIRWAPGPDLRLNLIVNYVGDMFFISDQANAYKPLNDYVTVDANVNVLVKNLELFLGINNLFDARYAEYGVISNFAGTRNFYPSPGRNVIAGLRCKF